MRQEVGTGFSVWKGEDVRLGTAGVGIDSPVSRPGQVRAELVVPDATGLGFSHQAKRAIGGLAVKPFVRGLTPRVGGEVSPSGRLV